MKYIFICLLIVTTVKCDFNLQWVNRTESQEYQRSTVFQNGELTEKFNSRSFDNPLICTNNMLKLIQFMHVHDQSIYSSSQLIEFVYNGQVLKQTDIDITVEPNKESPYPKTILVSNQSFILQANCADQIDPSNYYNHVKVSLLNGKYEFSFLLNCDKKGRNKKFQFGYLIIGLINAALTIGVALHSRIWSIKFNEKPLRIQLSWKKFAIIMVIILIIGLTLYLIATINDQEFKQANIVLKYIGIVVSFVFTFICFNQMLYLYRPMKVKVYETRIYSFRICEVVSFVLAVICFVISLFFQNWIFYNFLACCVCVGCIKMFYFDSMQQAFYSLSISVVSVTIIAIISHSLLQRSYNDYASQLSSPLFIEVPDLVNNLFKKCSWLPVVDIIVPGVFLSYLRLYDQNLKSSWGGVYTITGNISFLVSTAFWISIQVFWPFSVPFSLITYTFLLFSISLLAFKRNELKTLWYGYFQKQHEIDRKLLEEGLQRSSGQFIPEDTKNAIQIRESFNSQVDEDQSRVVNFDNKQHLGEKVYKSAFHTKKQVLQQRKSKQQGNSRSNIR